MARIHGSVPNLLNGVTQQPQAIRLGSQGTIQENWTSSPVDGLTRRPPATYISKITDESYTDAFVHIINRDSSEKYAAIVSTSGVRVFDLITGDEKTVNYPATEVDHIDGSTENVNPKDYLNVASPAENFKAVTVADYTFLVNTVQPTQLLSDLEPTPTPQAVIEVRQANYATNHEVYVNQSLVGSYTTPKSTDVNAETEAQTDSIASNLIADIASSLGAGYVTEQMGSTIHLKRTDGSDFSIYTVDSFGDQALSAAKGTVQQFVDLPAVAKAGMTVKVQGDPGTDAGSYWVKYVVDPSGVEHKGYWEEVAAPNTQIRIDKRTMPHALIRTADGTFDFRAISWADREAGGNKQNPHPTFIGNTIKDVFFHENRLGFLSDENVVMSRSGGFFNFYKATAEQMLATDPIDVAASHKQVSRLNHAVVFAENLLLFSSQTQFVLGTGNQLLSPQNVSMNAATNYESSSVASPVSIGNVVFFPSERGDYAALMEYYIEGNGEVRNVNDVTEQSPRYVPGEIRELTASSHQKVVCLRSARDKQGFYVYQYTYVGNEKKQSAWSRWSFGKDTEVVSMRFLQDELIVILRRPDGMHLTRMLLNEDKDSLGARYVTHLDMRQTEASLSMSYGSSRDETTITLPYEISPNEPLPMAVTREDLSESTTGAGGEELSLTSASNNKVTIAGDVTGKKFWLGTPFTSLYRPAEIEVRSRSSNERYGRLQLHNVYLELAKTGKLYVDVGGESEYTTYFETTGSYQNTAENSIAVFSNPSALGIDDSVVGSTFDSDEFYEGGHVDFSILDVQEGDEWNSANGGWGGFTREDNPTQYKAVLYDVYSIDYLITETDVKEDGSFYESWRKSAYDQLYVGDEAFRDIYGVDEYADWVENYAGPEYYGWYGDPTYPYEKYEPNQLFKANLYNGSQMWTKENLQVALVRKSDGVEVARDRDHKTPFAVSFDVPKTDPHYETINGRAWLYDQAVLCIAFINAGATGRVEKIVRGMVEVQADNGEMPFSVHAPSMYVIDPYFRTGSVAWVGKALAWFVKKMPSSSEVPKAKDALRLLCDGLIDEYWVEDPSRYQNHTFTGGRGKYARDYSWFDPDYRENWSACEHQVDCYWLYKYAYEIFGDPTYLDIRDKITEKYRTDEPWGWWSPSKQRCVQGLRPDFVDYGNTLDINSWSAPMLADIGETSKAEKCMAQLPKFKFFDRGTSGYTAYPPSRNRFYGGIWPEGSFGVCLAKTKFGRKKEAQEDFRRILQLNTEGTVTGGLPYITIKSDWYEMETWPAVIGWAWSLLAAKPEGFWGVPNPDWPDEIFSSVDIKDFDTYVAVSEGLLYERSIINGLYDYRYKFTAEGGVYQDKRFKVPVYRENNHAVIDISAEGWEPASVIRIDWDGRLTRKSYRRV